MAKQGGRALGQRVKRREDPALVTGRALFVADLRLEGLVHLAVVRSPLAHARVRGMDAGRALAIEGVLGVLGAEDVNPYLHAPLPVILDSERGRFEELAVPSRYPLAGERVRHVGDPVAVVVAESPYVAADAREQVEVDYEPLPVSTDPERAMSEDAAPLHEQAPRNRAFVWSVSGGDVDEAFARAAKRVELRARIQRLIPNALEPRAVAAAYDGQRDRLTVWSTTQVPHRLRDDLAAILGVPEERLRVIAPEVGGGFGAKGNAYPEEVLVPFLARRLRRPVRWVASRSEDYLATTHGRDQIDTLWLAADERGRVLAAELEVLADCGAYYSRAAPIVSPLTGLMMTGVYDIPCARARVVGVFTNKVPTEPYRGAGRPEAAYLIERGMDLLAAELGCDPVEVRRRNFIPKERFPYRTATGLQYDSGDYAHALDEALRRSGYRRWRREQARRRREGGRLLGIGVSCYVEICGFGPWELGTVRVGADGSILVLTGTSPHGQGHETSWAQIASDVLEVPLRAIRVAHGDTGIVPRGIGTFGSRSAAVGGAAVLESAQKVKEGALRIAAHLLEAAEADVRLEGGRFQVVGVPARSLGWQEVAAAAHAAGLPSELRRALDQETEFAPRGETYPFGAHVSVVEIDPETGEIAILRYVCVDDCGRVINPLLVEGQVHGGIAQGVGQALWEVAVYDEDGNLVSGSLMDYALPRADRLPAYETARTETPTPLNALGVKGIGEAATIGSTPAVVNAVVDALSPFGVRHLDTPLLPETIWRILRQGKTGTAGVERPLRGH